MGEAGGSVPVTDGSWETVGPSDTAFDGLAAPRALTTDEVAALPAAFAEAARRADRAGFDAIDLHGYLLHQFLSPLVNERADVYGGSFENRTRLIVDTVRAIREVWPDEKVLLVRLSATDWAEGGWDLEQTVLLSAVLRDLGADLVDVSSGGAVAHQDISVHPGYQVPFAAAVRRAAGVATSAVGLIDDPRQAQDILDAGDADVIMLARAAIREPSWPLRAAHELGVKPDDAPYAPQHVRGAWRS